MQKLGIKILIISLLIILLTTKLFSQENDLTKIYSILDKYTKDQTYSLNELNLINLNIKKREVYVKELKKEITEINSTVFKIENTIKKLEIELNTSKTVYEKLIYFAFLYKYEYNDFTFLLSAENINKIFFRLKYLKMIALYRQNIIEAIKFIKVELTNQEEILTNQKEIKNILLSNYNKEKTTLESEIEENLQLIEKLKQKNVNFRNELVADENLHKEILTILTSSTKFATNESQEATMKFVNDKGNYFLPIKNGIIVKEFGEYQHPVLTQVVVKNDGIDIAPSDDFKVRAFADGLVSNILSIPGANHAILIKHGEYFTVYSNIVNIDVVVNQKVTKEQIIGYISEDKTEVSVLNFQVWHLAEKQDPKDWLTSE